MVLADVVGQDLAQNGWLPSLEAIWHSEKTNNLRDFLWRRYADGRIYPQNTKIFQALKATPIDKVKVIILGQDPYYGPNQANGLAFAVNHGCPIPPSLRNIFKEVENDLGITIQKDSSLLGWANQGVLLLNSILTVEEGRPGSHRNIGWEDMTDAIITGVSRQREGVVFLLWGNYAQTKGKRIDLTKHAVLTACHPSPLSSYCFFGCRHFSKTNEILKGYGKQPINWAQTGLEGDSDDFLRRHFKRA